MGKKNIGRNCTNQLTKRESTFINTYIETGSGAAAMKAAGYSENTNAETLLKRPYIQEALKKRREEIYKNDTATASEILCFLSKVVRGEIQDQFGLDATLQDRIKAADMLGKRLIDNMPKEQHPIEVKLQWDNFKSNTDISSSHSNLAAEIEGTLQDEEED